MEECLYNYILWIWRKNHLLLFSEKLYRVCAKCETCAAIHTEEPDTVQVMGLRYLSGVWVHHFCHDSDQHSQSCHEILQTTSSIHSIPRCSQCHIHSLLYHGVCLQIRCLPIQGMFGFFRSFQFWPFFYYIFDLFHLVLKCDFQYSKRKVICKMVYFLCLSKFLEKYLLLFFKK